MTFEDSGFEIIRSLLAPNQVKILKSALAKLRLAPLRGGIRRIEHLVPKVAALAKSFQLLSVAQRYLTGSPQLVRAIYFDKSPENNWFVTWHQDKTVAVSQRFEAEGWGPWSLKADIWHVQPPIALLRDMITIRIHLDSAATTNGCLKVIPGSHNLGLLATEEVQKQACGQQAVYCEVPAGGALIMRPHVLHASEKSVAPHPRRVLHFEYSSFELPKGITWCA